MVNIWDSIKATGESVSGALTATPMAWFDLASMPFDDEDDDFGSVLAVVSRRAGDMLDPIMNEETISGMGVSKALEGFNWALWNVANEPITTLEIATQHANAKGNLGVLFDGATWSKAYEQAQFTSLGEAVSFGMHNQADRDPFDYKDPYNEVTLKENPFTGPLAKWGVNIAAAWYGDPAIVAAKGLSAAKAATYSGKLSNAKRADLYNEIANGSRSGKLRESMASRTDKYLDWIGGTNKFQRPLTGPEILHATPELKKYATEPHVIAGLLADANKLGDDVLRRDTQRRILAVAAGDTTQIARLKAEQAQSGAIADALGNMLKEGPLDLKRLAATPTLAQNPRFIAHLERQLDNINKDQSIDRFMDGWNASLDQLVGLERKLPNLPGYHAAGARALNRENETGVRGAVNKVDDWAAARWERAQGSSSLFQKGRYTVPILAVKPFHALYLKAPVAISKAMRQTHFTGVANLHDWGGATTQLDSMMKLTNVAPGERMKALSEAYLAKTEIEKMRAIDKIESLSMKSLADEFSIKGKQPIDRAYIEELMIGHASSRDRRLGHLRGRVYAATVDPRRAKAAQAVDDAAGGGRGFSATPQGQWRVDQISDDGMPLAMPVLETHLGDTVPLLDMQVARKLLERDNGSLARLSRAWAEESKELAHLANLKRAGHTGLDRTIAARAASRDWLVYAGQKTMRLWKFSVLFRLGYPMRVVMDDHWRIWTQMRALTFYGDNGKELFANMRNNVVDRRLAARRDLHAKKVERQQLREQLDDDLMVSHAERQAELKTALRSARAHQTQVTKLRTQLEEAETKKSLGIDVDIKAIRERLGASEKMVRHQEAHANYLREQLGEVGPEDLKRRIAELDEMIALGPKGLRADKRRIGSANVKLDEGVTIEGSMAGHGDIFRDLSSSKGTFDYQLKGVEDNLFAAGMGGSHRTILPGEDGHLDAWADVINHQFRNSAVAMHFIKGGDIDSFVQWIKLPEQATLRRRVPHFAHDPEDWGGRVQAMVFDYLPSDDLIQAVQAGRVSARQLGKMFGDPTFRPAVHGRAAADNLGTSGRVLGIGRGVNALYRFIGEMPTDRLSRHPFFNSLYKQHARDAYETKKIAYAAEGRKFTQEDFDDIVRTSRKLALNDLKRTLFDISAHSQAAHVMRFVSPFFAAHQESLARWWRIVGDDPSVVRRFTQAFDVPRHMGIVIDEDGELVKPGDTISREHRILIQLPKEFGGPDTDPDNPDSRWGKWSVSENSFNLVLQGGLANPGVGPLVTVPVEFFAEKYAREKDVATLARVFNPFPPQSPIETAIAATLKRLSGLTYGLTGVDPSLGLGIGAREYNAAMGQNVKDLTIDFKLQNGREPTKAEAEDIMATAGRDATVQMFHRFLWNAGSPAPAQPNSKYSIVQNGWWRISAQARAEGRDYDWAWAQFKAKWGEVYAPLIASEANNPAGLDATAATAAALGKYRGVLDKVDPAVHRAIIGGYSDDLIQQNATLGEYSPEARNYLRNARMQPGSPDTYYSYDDPRTAIEEQMARRGWRKYGDLTGSLTAIAQRMGLSSYRESDQLVALKRAGVARIRQENWAFDKDYGNFDSTEFDRYLSDLRTVVATPALANDPTRTDIKTLDVYLKVRDYFTALIDQRDAAGFGGYQAQANEGLLKVYTYIVGKLVESNTYFESNIFNGLLERDPLLIDDVVATAEGMV